MKALLFFIGTLAAGLIGFMYEPSFRKELTGKEPGRLIGKGDEEFVSQKPVVINLAEWPADRLPGKVKLKASAEVASETNGLKLSVPAGSEVDLVRLEGDKVVISPGAEEYQGVVLVSQTDLVEQIKVLARNQPDVPTVSEVPSVPTAPEIVDVPEPEPPSVPQTPVAPEEPVPVTPEEKPEVVDTPTVPDEQPEPVAPPASGGGNVVEIMQASVRAGDIQEFTFDQVLNWDTNEGEEVVDGVSYKIGSLSYKKDTIFGEKTIQAKALIENGKVAKWIWVNSGMVIK